MVPFDSEDLKGVVYVWIGGKAEHEEATLAEKIAYMMYAVSKNIILIDFFHNYISPRTWSCCQVLS